MAAMLWLTNNTVRPSYAPRAFYRDIFSETPHRLPPALRRRSESPVPVRGHGESQTHVHAADVTFHGRVEELLDFRKCDDLVKLPLDLFSRHAQDRAVEKDVFPAVNSG